MWVRSCGQQQNDVGPFPEFSPAFEISAVACGFSRFFFVDSLFISVLCNPSAVRGNVINISVSYGCITGSVIASHER